MDTTGLNQVGRYGTLSLLKRRLSAATFNPPLSPNDLITSFGIDETTLTFGSTSTCGVRLYYPDVDPLHCQLVFEDGKAFLSVLGQGGVFVDGCWVYPHSSSSGSTPSTQEQQHQQTIIPLSNNSEFEIHHKRFRFTYPPKEIRKVLLATPAPVHKRALRLSMIQSAQVFSPRPSKDPRENLRILQTPLKQGIFPPRTPTGGKSPTRTRAVSPLKYSSKSGSDSDSDDEHDKAAEEEPEAGEEEIVLVATNHPRVVEEEHDLVILEDVPCGPGAATQAGPGSPSHIQAPAPVQGGQVAPAQPPSTPRRKSLGGTALHRAVLIRSAQRAVWRAEREKEEEEEREEEMEVLGAVVAPVEANMDEEDGEEYDEEYDDDDVEMRSVSSEDDGADEEDDAEALAEKAENKPLWRKSLERIIPWGFSASANEDENEEDETHGDTHDNEKIDEDNHEEDENEEPAPLPSRPAQTPVRRVLGSFMTPQAHNAGQPQRNIFPAAERSQAPMAPPGLPEPTPAAAPAPGPGRYSLGGGEARRVLIQQPWRVKDLVVPPPAPAATASPGRPRASGMAPPATPTRDAGGAAPRQTPAVTADERRAIQERRRSAVREVREDTFWKDGAPGMSPAKPSARMSVGGAPPSSSPVKGGAAMSVPRRPAFASPAKGRALGYAIAEEGGPSTPAAADEAQPSADDAQDDALDTRSLLDRMRETVEDMKRRRSVVAATPRPEPALDRPAPTSVALASPARMPGGGFALGSVKKLDFSRINSPAVRAGPAPSSAHGEDKHAAAEDAEARAVAEAVMQQDEPFSLLRPNAATASSSRKPASRSTRQADQKVEDAEVRDEVRAVPLPAVVVDDAQEDAAKEEEAVQKPKEVKAKPRGRSKLLRAPKPAAAVEAAEEDEMDVVPEASQSQVKTKATRGRAAKSPAPPPVLEEPAPGPPATRRQRSKTPQPAPEEETEPHATRSGTTRRTRKGTTEPEEPAPAPAAKRGKKAIVEPEQEEQETKTKTPAAKRGRKPRGAPVADEHEHEEETVAEAPDAAPVAAAPAKRSRSRKAAASVALEPEPETQDGDELDSYDVRPASSTKPGSAIPVKAPPKGRKKAMAAAVKQEPAEDAGEGADAAVPLATTRGGRAAAAAKTPAAPKPVAGPATKPRGKPRTPASGPAGPSSSAASAEKENTHGTAGSGSVASDEADDAPVKVRVSRRTGAAAAAALDAGKAAVPRSAPKTAGRAAVKSKVKVEEEPDNEDEAGAGAVRGRTTRVTRMRTKTG